MNWAWVSVGFSEQFSRREALPRAKRCILRRAAVRCASVESWAKERGIKWKNLELHDFSSAGGRGIRAVEEVKPNNIIMTVPANAALEVDNVRFRAAPKELVADSSAWRATPWWARLAILLIHEKRKGDDSVLNNWIPELPTHFNHFLRWSDEERQLLGYKPLQTKAAEEDKLLRELHRKLVAHAGVSFREFCWAVDCIRSRAFSGPAEMGSFRERVTLFLFIWLLIPVFVLAGAGGPEQALNGAGAALFSVLAYDLIYPRVLRAMQDITPTRYVLCPFVDFFNHRSGTPSDIAYEFFYDSFSVRTGAADRGDQVFISYGDRSNDQLLLYYGFVEKDNPNDVYVFADTFEELVKTRKDEFAPYADRIDEMLKAGLLRTASVVASRKSLKGPIFDDNTVECVRLIVADKQDFESFKTTKRFSKQFSDQNERDARALLHIIVEAEIETRQNWPLQGEAAKMRDAPDVSAREALRSTFQSEKKHLLADICKAFALETQ